jgi:chemotaxis protein methyltransferase CheR
MARVADLVRERTGLVFPEARVAEVEATVRRAMSRRGVQHPDPLVDVLREDSAVRDALVAELTIGESYFQRDSAQFELMRRQVLPALLGGAAAGRPVRVWSAGCAAGEEPYSVAMLLDELGALRRAEIVGTDISRPRLNDAQRGVYSAWSLRGMSDDVRRRYFRERGRYFELDARIREPVDFRYLNLAEDAFPSLSIGIWGMDLILCRNVLIYFDRPTVERVARRLVESLSEGGWLILGASDPAIAELVECDVVVTPAGLAYRRPGAAGDDDARRAAVSGRGGSRRGGTAPAAGQSAESSASSAAPEQVASKPAAPEEGPSQPAPPLDAAAGPWRELEGAAADAPVDRKPPPAEAGARGSAATPEAVIAAYGRRRFDEVRRLAEAVPPAELTEAAWLAWLRALANQGCLEEAAAVAEQAVEARGASAELLYLHAVLVLQTGSAAAAAALARRALYLDRDLVVAHMTMAEAQRRLGNSDAARRALRSAAGLLSALPPDALVPGSDGEHAGRLAELVRVKLELLAAAPHRSSP